MDCDAADSDSDDDGYSNDGRGDLQRHGSVTARDDVARTDTYDSDQLCDARTWTTTTTTICDAGCDSDTDDQNPNVCSDADELTSAARTPLNWSVTTRRLRTVRTWTATGSVRRWRGRATTDGDLSLDVDDTDDNNCERAAATPLLISCDDCTNGTYGLGQRRRCDLDSDGICGR